MKLSLPRIRLHVLLLAVAAMSVTCSHLYSHVEAGKEVQRQQYLGKLAVRASQPLFENPPDKTTEVSWDLSRRGNTFRYLTIRIDDDELLLEFQVEKQPTVIRYTPHARMPDILRQFENSFDNAGIPYRVEPISTETLAEDR